MARREGTETDRTAEDAVSYTFLMACAIETLFSVVVVVWWAVILDA